MLKIKSGYRSWSPGFSRSRLSRQYAAALAGIQPAKAGTPECHIEIICSKLIQRNLQKE